ncbi:DSBA oxidoreductase [Paenibacillus curdlanolyticus YK9]|uniref:DSBA oxidoreductase n=1 Tax=Paenibacillus curdlanolyticus YK9 TaxID=717606 RepID=E0IEN0_9BACL|nr:DsbA family oxidoreductase [Paenibacillus curdlanolyticus]EFM09118.1 DSBA oxidoreductase [Paenibacillus curdlanolyticus YK9]
MHIEIYSDYVCPWCRIGKKNLFDALADWTAEHGIQPTLTYRAFLLDPSVPEQGSPFQDWINRKMGGSAPSERATAQVTQAAAAVGLTMQFDRISIYPSTRLAHRMIALTPLQQQTAAVDALFKAYFEEGIDIGSIEHLMRIADGIGIEDTDELAAKLLLGDGEEDVAADLQRAERIGVTGVPFFVFDGKYALSGAYPKVDFAALLSRLAFDPSAGER